MKNMDQVQTLHIQYGYGLVDGFLQQQHPHISLIVHIERVQTLQRTRTEMSSLLDTLV